MSGVIDMGESRETYSCLPDHHSPFSLRRSPRSICTELGTRIVRYAPVGLRETRCEVDDTPATPRPDSRRVHTGSSLPFAHKHEVVESDVTSRWVRNIPPRGCREAAWW